MVHDGRLIEVLRRAQALGFLGPGPVAGQVEVAAGLGAAFESCAGPLTGQAVDLGSGGGVPGLVLAARWPGSTWVLLDSQLRRTQFLEVAVRELNLEVRVSVLRERAEPAGRRVGMRGHFDLVSARSFGPPAVTAECGAPFLKVGGRLLVADPPRTSAPVPETSCHGGGGSGPARQSERWPATPLRSLGLVVEGQGAGPPAWTLLRQVEPCPERFPRRTGVPAKRPLYRVEVTIP